MVVEVEVTTEAALTSLVVRVTTEAHLAMIGCMFVMVRIIMIVVEHTPEPRQTSLMIRGSKVTEEKGFNI
ncbi:hypothetical protein A2U01_0050648 [Trifolium medium]|uniref:Uncharacterized protein n=1 Tax=Trifolium medium TaxID=97028 RepID=A0A392QZM7_9FABA|nr:hypothetical protein [Trifolium medium]